MGVANRKDGAPSGAQIFRKKFLANFNCPARFANPYRSQKYAKNWRVGSPRRGRPFDTPKGVKLPVSLVASTYTHHDSNAGGMGVRTLHRRVLYQTGL